MTTTNFTKADGTEVTPEMQAKKAEMIGKLIAMSEDEANTPEARAAYAEKAERLMREYRIDEESVISSGTDAVTVPVAFRITLIGGNGRWWQSEFQSEYVRIWNEISKHAELKSHVIYAYDDEAGTRSVVAVGYGYEIDVRLAQFLWTSAHLAFATRIDTKVDKSLSDQLNCYFMRGAGMERNDIATALWGSDAKDGIAHGRVQKFYLAECAKREEQPMVGGRGFIAKRYREHYARGFTDQFGWRLRDARSAIDAESGALVLQGRAERVNEAYWAAYPDKAPMTAEARAKQEARDAEMAERWEAEERACRESGPCSRAKTGNCKRHRPYEATQADRQRWAREQNAPERSAGRRAGAAAASSVDFRRTAGDRQPKAPASPERRALG